MSGVGLQTCVSRKHVMPFGAELLEEGAVRFRFWAPVHQRVGLAIEGEDQPLGMHSSAEGWHELTTDRAQAGSLYRFALPDGTRVPDPASRFQPQDVHGPSEVIDSRSYAWRDERWMGRPWLEAVIYELHVGTFTEAGTFRAAADKLDHLVALGVTGIEIMPVSDFPGQRNWGYDGVLPYAPDSTYGRPEDLKAFIELAHLRGLMVLLDVVYNHFGPDGNYLSLYSPQFFTERHKTAWGSAINYDGPDSRAVREFIIHNALYWIEEFHLDGLRLDAVHAIWDDSSIHLLKELAEQVRALAEGRSVHLILENEENQASLLEREETGQPRWYTAQWNDDVHHVIHTAATGEQSGYYSDFRGDTEKLGRALAEGFAFQGEMMSYRGKRRGEPSTHLPPDAFIAFLQNHDQIGNRAFGDRINVIAPPEAVRAASAVYLLLPQIPMFFMGDEWSASQPFRFFSDFSGELAERVRKGRREEFAAFPEFRDPETRKSIPDPEAEETFLSAKLAWVEIGEPLHAVWLEWYRRILAVRRGSVLPLLSNLSGTAARYEVIGDGAVVVRWGVGQSRQLTLAANLSDKPLGGFPAAAGVQLWSEGDPGQQGVFGGWSVRWSLEESEPSRK